MIHYHIGDATQPVGYGQKLIVHVCNDRGLWGAGFTRALSRRWKVPEIAYRHWAYRGTDEQAGLFVLGGAQAVRVSEDITVVNMIAQVMHGAPPRIRYNALQCCLAEVRNLSRRGDDTSVHMPRIGCGLAGGTWAEVEPIVANVFWDRQVHVYDLEAP